MKKTAKFLVVAAIMVFATSSSLMAQFKIGAKAGVAMNGMFGKNSFYDKYEVKPVCGFNVGIVGEYMINEKMNISAEVLYALQGYSLYFEKDFVSEPFSLAPSIHSEGNINTFSNHINVPVMFRYHFGSFAVEAGPQVGFCLGGKEKSHIESDVTGPGDFLPPSTTHQTYDYNYTFEELESNGKERLGDYRMYNRVNVGFAVGVGYEFDFGMFLNVRYAMDFTNSYNKIISDETTGKAVSWEKFPSKQWGAALSVGYKFKIK
ncbi:MAG: PorT family protein [Bacteroidales bacterium]|nr:PorT family protein [Bacteroidales bacterium]